MNDDEFDPMDYLDNEPLPYVPVRQRSYSRSPYRTPPRRIRNSGDGARLARIREAEELRVEQERARARSERKRERLQREEARRLDLLRVDREKYAMWNNDRPHFEQQRLWWYEYPRMSAEDFQEERFILSLMD